MLLMKNLIKKMIFSKKMNNILMSFLVQNNQHKKIRIYPFNQLIKNLIIYVVNLLKKSIQ